MCCCCVCAVRRTSIRASAFHGCTGLVKVIIDSYASFAKDAAGFVALFLPHVC